MAIAASLWFDPVLERRIRELWAEFARAGVSRALHDGPYRPHVTLAVWEPDRSEQLRRALRRGVASATAFEISFGSVGTFPGVVYLCPAESDELFALHESICSLASEAGARPEPTYPLGPWVPHCTLAWKLTDDQVARARGLASGLTLPLTGSVEAIGIVDTPVEAELERLPLAAGLSG